MKHHQQAHPHMPVTSNGGHSDGIYNHTCMIILLGLMRALHNRAIQLGNGVDLMSLYKYVITSI